MAVRKPLTQFTTPLGSGAGVPKDKRPPRVTDSATRLSKPFKVPFASSTQNSVSSETITISRRPVRSTRKRTNYAVDGITLEKDDEEEYNNDQNVNGDGQIIKRKNLVHYYHDQLLIPIILPKMKINLNVLLLCHLIKIIVNKQKFKEVHHHH